MRRVVRSAVAVFALLLSLLIVPTVGAAPGAGNSDAAKICQKGGYANYVRTNGTAFENTGDCVSYVTRGGTLVQSLLVTIERTSPTTIVTTVTGYTIGDTICFQGLNTDGRRLGDERCIPTTTATVSTTGGFPCTPQTYTRVINTTTRQEVIESNPGC